MQAKCILLGYDVACSPRLSAQLIASFQCPPTHTPRHQSVSQSIMRGLCWWEEEEKSAEDGGREVRDVGLITVMDEGEDAGWWLLSPLLNPTWMWTQPAHGIRKPQERCGGWRVMLGLVSVYEHGGKLFCKFDFSLFCFVFLPYK